MNVDEQDRVDMELRKALIEIADRAPVPQEFAEIAGRGPQGRRTPRRRLLIATAIVVLVGAGGLWWVLSDESGTTLLANEGIETPGTPTAGQSPQVGVDGVWILVSADVDGQSVASGLHLEIAGSTISGETICEQEFGGELGGALPQTTEEGCDAEGGADLELIDARFMSAITSGPALEGDRLVFIGDGVRLTYERTIAVSPEDLFGVLEDEALAADSSEIFLDPEAGRRPEFDTLVRLEHPSTQGRFFVGTNSDLVCFVISSDVAALGACDLPRRLATLSTAFSLESRDGPTGLRAALIPDAFVEVAGLSDIGLASGNVLVLATSTEPGDYVLTNSLGDELVISVPG